MKPLNQQSDEALRGMAVAGDRAAEEYLVARYAQLVRACARPYFLAGGDSEDLIQEGMIGLLSAIRSFSPDREAGFRTYAETCIRNRLRSAVRTAARDKHRPLNHSISLDDPFFDGNEDPRTYNAAADRLQAPEDLLIGREEREGRMKALRNVLSGFEKTVLELYLAGLSQNEIAQRVGKSLKSVDNAVQRIRRKASAFFAL